MKKKERKRKRTGRGRYLWARLAPRKVAAWAPDGLSMSGSRGWSCDVLKIMRSCGLSAAYQEPSPLVVKEWRRRGDSMAS
jgi:hypothetical protein